MRNDKPFGGPAPPGVVFYYSRNRKGEHPRGCLSISDDAFSDDDWAITTAFTDEGIENLKYIVDAIKDA